MSAGLSRGAKSRLPDPMTDTVGLGCNMTMARGERDLGGRPGLTRQWATAEIASN